jgi:hypothetical protein
VSVALGGVALAGSVLAALLLSAGWPALVYAIIFSLAIVPGLPLGWRLFGRHHPAGWIGGALVGYGITQLALWTVIQLGAATAATVVLAWLLAGGATLAVSRVGGRAPWVSMPEWKPGDARALLLVLLLVPVLMAPPYRNLGRTDESGNRFYRAYFTADFVWHSALAYELGKFALPPRNPYMAPRAMNYYWTYFLLPATVARLSPAPLDDVQPPLEANAILVGVLMMGALFLLVRSGVSSAWPAAVAVLLAVVAASAEGTYAIVDLVSRGRPLQALLETNIDAVTAWQFGGLRIDNIPRSLWYTPQHTTSIALGLIALLVGVQAGLGATWGAIASAGLALGLATTMNPLLGAVCSAIYGLCILSAAVTTPRGWRFVMRHALAAVPVVLAVGWGAASRVMDGAGSALDFGFSGFSRRSPLVTLLLSLGPILVPALPGMLRAPTDLSRRSVAAAVSGISIGLVLLYLVRISEASWVGFRAGQVLLVSIPILLARTLERLGPRAGAALAVAVLAIGLPTTAIDTWNAQDIGNRRPGPGFRWTLWTTPAQQQAFEWLRANTPPDAIVQMEPMIRAREHWTLIPSFAGRRMAAGLPISLLPLPEYTERSERVRTLFATTDVAVAVDIARRLRIDYVYVDREDAAGYPLGVRKFDEHPERFERVFANEEVRIYRVL